MPSYLATKEVSHPPIPPTPESDGSKSPKCPTPSDTATPPADEAQPSEPQPSRPQKRKAGRKPIYKTAQERRDRNRRAQLAFRARRSDYLIQLEETCRSLEMVVMELQDSNRLANDALICERNKVRFLASMLQSQVPSTAAQDATMFPFQHTLSVPLDNVETSTFPAQCVLNPEQQFPPTSGVSALHDMGFSQNNLGMLPLPLNDLQGPRVLV